MASQESSKIRKSSDPPLALSPIILGGATFSNIYNSDDDLKRNTPESTLLFALRNGINAVDTAPYYGNSQSIIGQITSKPEFRAGFPRSSYHLLTKCGRYGPKDFDYSPERIRRSVEESCTLMGTDYLDAVYLHDVEYVAEDPDGFNKGGHCGSCSDSQDAQLDPAPVTEKYTQSYGPGDDTVVLAVKTLFQLKKEGLIRRVGISGYPLATLLRMSHLIVAQLDCPLDLVMSYSCLTLQNSALDSYLPYFQDSGVVQIISASPLGNGLLTSRGPQDWHPAPQTLRQAIKDVTKTIQTEYQLSIEHLSLLYSMYFPHTVIGFSSVEEVKTALDVLEEIQNPKDTTRVSSAQAAVKDTLKKSGFLNWSWPSPSD
ncbi:hypothetical protein PtA15_8A432 [Puccinia triticina]|uniref:NADP-dependent oxidoreductase domain-containing protein n=1 Tax=Puccinia triticina TaxID=208348 RepID=A0ABY7CRH0_9BASI|nr:uncharacterized protein PtA15_8A432 [Puccinia triticina]WAQ87528.1 hypothetical protein PtA15_8A432 [Puccinia triticina]